MNVWSYLTVFFLPLIWPVQVEDANLDSSITEGLIAHYDFNHCEAYDLTKGGSDGLAYGQPSCHCGVEGNGMFFDGINDYLEFPGRVNQAFNTTDFTVSFYVKPGKYSVFSQSMLSKRAICYDSVMMDLQLDATLKKIKTDLYESPYKYFKNISPELPETDWVHYALVRKGTWVYTYINGQLRREARKCSGVDIGNESLLSFANSPCVQGGRMVRFKGGLDELRIYNRALTEDEITEIYALHPVELAEADCVTFIKENDAATYLCDGFINRELFSSY